VIGLHSLLEYPLWYGPFQMAVGLSGVFLWRTRAELADSTRAPLSRATANGLCGLALLVLAGLGYAAWDYHRVSQIYLPIAQRSAAYKDNTLEKIRSSWLFQNQVRFAELTTTPLTPANAARLNAMAHGLLHLSPEARVVEVLIHSARLLGREDEALFYEQRLRAAYPKAR
jgi:Virulence factor membrane-bound polymerase, C-terminal